MDFIIESYEDTVATLTINREQALNALNSQVLHELNEALDHVKATPDIRALVITGAGTKAFVAGADIAEMHNLTPIEARDFLTYGQRVMDRIEQLAIPTIALVNGYALGGGFELALACDIRVGTENAVVGLPEVTLGLIPGFGGTQRLTKAVGISLAKSMIMLARRLSAQEALQFGIFTDVYASDDVEEKFAKLLKKLTAIAPIALHSAKQSVLAASNTDLKNGLLIEGNLTSMCFATEDLREGMGAFLEKRKPKFQGK